jgi:GTP-binding protein EngB required for normal cell division
VTVATKADKVSGSRRKNQLDMIRSELSLPEEAPLISFSSRTGLGRDSLLTLIADSLERTGEVSQEGKT